MKILKKVLFIAILIVISISCIIIQSGYNMYKEALKEMPLDNKVASIRAKENYTKIDEVPNMYKNAVISVEDHRFYKHNGIDVIAINRALFNDIKAMDFLNLMEVNQVLKVVIYIMQVH